MSYKKPKSRLNILVLGYIVRGPIAGMSWHHIQYIIGLNALGHQVSYCEDSGDSEYCCYNPNKGFINHNPFYGLSYLKKLFKKLNLENKWGYYDYHENVWHGKKAIEIYKRPSDYDLLINLSASNQIRDWMYKIPIRVLVDTDPVFSQIMNLQDSEKRANTLKHNVFFTFGENINSSKCQIPTDGFNWHPTRQPIVLDLWLNKSENHNGKFTNVMQWESYAPLEHNGIHYGVKADSFGPYFNLPKRTNQVLEIALGSSNAPRGKFRDNKWILMDPLEVSKDPWIYNQYIKNSKAEFSVAKQAYVKSRSGWFSERSASYLASGRPVLAQETGFSEWIETGGFGLLHFNSPEEAINGIETINANYQKHCNSARALAYEYFEAKKVLGDLIDNCLK